MENLSSKFLNLYENRSNRSFCVALPNVHLNSTECNFLPIICNSEIQEKLMRKQMTITIIIIYRIYIILYYLKNAYSQLNNRLEKWCSFFYTLNIRKRLDNGNGDHEKYCKEEKSNRSNKPPNSQ